MNIAAVARLEDTDKKFERPPPKSGASLYDPRLPSNKSRSGSKDRLENAGGNGVKGITQGVAGLSVTVPGAQARPSESRDDDQNQYRALAAKASDGATTNNENTEAVTGNESSSPTSGSSGAATAGTGNEQ